MIRRLGLLSACAAAITIVIGGQASAATFTLGPPTVTTADVTSFMAPGTCASGACPETAMPTQLSSGLLTAPADGTVTTWRVNGVAGTSGNQTLRVIAPCTPLFTGGTPCPSNAFFTTGSSSPESNFNTSSTSCSSNPVQTFSTSVLIYYGETVGLDWNRATGANTDLVCANSANTGDYDIFAPALGTGSGATPAATTGSVSEPLYNADVVPFAPVLSSVSPSSGSAGQTVTITGDHLAGATAVNFGSTPATFTVSDPGLANPNSTNPDIQHITATAPGGSGTIDVTVTGPGGTSATSTGDMFTYPAPPPGAAANPTPPVPATGRRAAALKKCKHKRGKARARCKKKAKKLPL